MPSQPDAEAVNAVRRALAERRQSRQLGSSVSNSNNNNASTSSAASPPAAPHTPPSGASQLPSPHQHRAASSQPTASMSHGNTSSTPLAAPSSSPSVSPQCAQQQRQQWAGDWVWLSSPSPTSTVPAAAAAAASPPASPAALHHSHPSHRRLSYYAGFLPGTLDRNELPDAVLPNSTRVRAPRRPSRTSPHKSSDGKQRSSDGVGIDLRGDVVAVLPTSETALVAAHTTPSQNATERSAAGASRAAVSRASRSRRGTVSTADLAGPAAAVTGSSSLSHRRSINGGSDARAPLSPSRASSHRQSSVTFDETLAEAMLSTAHRMKEHQHQQQRQRSSSLSTQRSVRGASPLPAESCSGSAGEAPPEVFDMVLCTPSTTPYERPPRIATSAEFASSPLSTSPYRQRSSPPPHHLAATTPACLQPTKQRHRQQQQSPAASSWQARSPSTHQQTGVSSWEAEERHAVCRAPSRSSQATSSSTRTRSSSQSNSIARNMELQRTPSEQLPRSETSPRSPADSHARLPYLSYAEFCQTTPLHPSPPSPATRRPAPPAAPPAAQQQGKRLNGSSDTTPQLSHHQLTEAFYGSYKGGKMARDAYLFFVSQQQQHREASASRQPSRQHRSTERAASAANRSSGAHRMNATPPTSTASPARQPQHRPASSSVLPHAAMNEATGAAVSAILPGSPAWVSASSPSSDPPRLGQQQQPSLPAASGAAGQHSTRSLLPVMLMSSSSSACSSSLRSDAEAPADVPALDHADVPGVRNTAANGGRASSSDLPPALPLQPPSPHVPSVEKHNKHQQPPRSPASRSAALQDKSCSLQELQSRASAKVRSPSAPPDPMCGSSPTARVAPQQEQRLKRQRKPAKEGSDACASANERQNAAVADPFHASVSSLQAGTATSANRLEALLRRSAQVYEQAQQQKKENAQT